MKLMSLREQREVEIEILDYVHQICKKNDILYSICGGTLLGAVRHKGFIPWDDDIDIFLLRNDYDKLINLVKADNKYQVFDEKVDDYYYEFAKISDRQTLLMEKSLFMLSVPDSGVNIDVFPVDELPNNDKLRLEYIAKMKKEQLKLRYSLPLVYANSNSKLKIVTKLIVFFPKHFFLRIQLSSKKRQIKIINEMKKSKSSLVKYVGFILSIYGEKEVLPVEFFSEFINVEFEKKYYCAIKDYDIYLTNLYGDYMTLPPVEKRKTHHHYDAYWRFENE